MTGPSNKLAAELMEERNKTARQRVEEASEKAYAEHMRPTAPFPDAPQSLGEWARLPSSRERVRRGDAWHFLAWYHHEVVRPMLEKYHEHVIEPQLKQRRSLREFITGKGPELPSLEELKAAWISPWEQLYRKEEVDAQKAAALAAEKAADNELARLDRLSAS